MTKVLRGILLSASMMTPMERAAGRFMRAPDHDAGTGGGGGAAGGGEGVVEAPGGESAAEAPAAETAAADSDDFSTFERAVDKGEVTTPAAEGGSEAEGGAEAEAGEEAAEGEGEGEPVDPNEARFSDLDRRLREADERNADLQRRLEEAAKKPEEKGDEKPRPEGLLEGEPNPEEYEYGEADPSYIKDSAAFHARLEFQRQQAQERLTKEFKDIDDGYQAKVKEAVESRYPDFEEKVVKTAEGPNPSWVATPVMTLAMRTSDVGPDVAYHLATNPEESRRIAALSPLEQAREMGRLEGKFAFAEKPQVEERRVTNAPNPPTKAVKGAGGKFKTSADTDDFAAFDKTYGNG